MLDREHDDYDYHYHNYDYDIQPGLDENQLDRALHSRATKIKDRVIKRAISHLKEEDRRTGKKLPRDMITYIRYINESFLDGLARVLKEDYVVKGANALPLFNRKSSADQTLKNSRSTKDVDLRIAKQFTREDLKELFDQIVGTQEFKLKTGLRFGKPKITITSSSDGILPGAQISCLVFFGDRVDRKANTKGMPFKLEMIFGSLDRNTCAISSYPTLAELADNKEGQSGFTISHVVPEAMIADKIHAIVRYGLANTRIKDLFDINYLITNFTLNNDLVKECTLNAFKEFGEEHLLIESVDEISGLDSKNFDLELKRIKWQVEWKNWTGYDIQEESACFIELSAVMDRVKDWIGSLGLFDKRTARTARIARLKRVPVIELITEISGLIGDVSAAFEDFTVNPNTQDINNAIAERIDLEMLHQPVVKLSYCFILSKICSERINAFLEAQSEQIVMESEAFNLVEMLDVLDELIGLIRETAIGAISPTQAKSNLAFLSTNLGLSIGSKFPMRTYILGRLKEHRREYGLIIQDMIVSAEELVLIEDQLCFENALLDAKANLPISRNALVYTCSQIEKAVNFCDCSQNVFLKQAVLCIRKMIKDIVQIEKALEKAERFDLTKKSTIILNKEIADKKITVKRDMEIFALKKTKNLQSLLEISLKL